MSKMICRCLRCARIARSHLTPDMPPPEVKGGSKIMINLHQEENKMQMSDVIADMLTRIRNANTAKHATVDIPASNMKKSIAEILVEEGYIKSYTVVDDGKQGIIRVTLKYLPGKQKVIRGIKRISKPGLRIYASCEDMPKVMNGLGIAIVSTSKGVMTDKKARSLNVGGEVLAFVW